MADLNNITPMKGLPPFLQYFRTIGIIPASYKVTMTYEEQVLELMRFIRDEIIPKINENVLATQELQEKFKELVTYVEEYFENLDIQEEVNIKLDEMAESGTLAEIIAQYIQLASIIAFNNVENMKSATNIIEGSLLKTYGYNSYNDMGGAFYRARQITNQDVIDNTTLIALNDVNLVAELITPETINPEIFGAFGDGVHDDTTEVSNAINFAIINKIPFVAEKIYKISDTINLHCDNQYIKFTNKILYTGNSILFHIIGNYNILEFNSIRGTANNIGTAIYLTSNSSKLNSHNKIKFNNINKFNYGIYLDALGEETFGIQYNDIEGGFIDEVNFGIYGEINNLRSSWINQNYFHHIRINGNYGIYLVNNTQSEVNCNSNIFEKIGFETTYTKGVYLDYVFTNSFIDCRAGELVENEILVDCQNCKHCEFKFTQPIPLEKINNVNSTFKIFGTIQATENRITMTNYGAFFFIDESLLYLDNQWKNSGRIYNAYNGNLDLTANNRKDVAFDMMYRFGADVNNDYIIKLNDANIYRSVIRIHISNVPGTFTITVKDKNDNVLIPSGTINSAGDWTIVKESSNKWYAYK